MHIDMNMKIVNTNWGEPASVVADEFLDCVGINGDVELSGDDRIGFATITADVEVDADTGRLVSRSDMVLDMCRAINMVMDRAMMVTLNIKVHAEDSTSCVITMRNKDVVVVNIKDDEAFPCSTITANNIISWAE